jgi:VanZ family protein
METKLLMSPSEPWRNPRPAPTLDEVRDRVPPKSMISAWLRAWWPALLWSVVIFAASTDTFSSGHTASVFAAILHWFALSLSETAFDTIHFFIRKSAHLTEYFIFYLLLYRGIRGARIGWHWSWAFAAWFIAAAYAALDEIHQSFVASRTASAWDSLLDSAGALVALLVLFLIHRLRHPRASA